MVRHFIPVKYHEQKGQVLQYPRHVTCRGVIVQHTRVPRVRKHGKREELIHGQYIVNVEGRTHHATC